MDHNMAEGRQNPPQSQVTFHQCEETQPECEETQPETSFGSSTDSTTFQLGDIALSESELGCVQNIVTSNESSTFSLNLESTTTTFIQKLIAEFISTSILVFAGCGSVVVNTKSRGQVTHVGISIVWGLVITILVYTVGHISGCHLNPAVTIAFASVKRFKWRMVPCYIVAQVGGAIFGSHMIRIVLGSYSYLGATLPAGSDIQSFVLEAIITFILMFVVMGVGTDTVSISELGGVAIGSTVALNALFAGPISGASMNPARSLGPALIAYKYTSLWVYMAGPVIGALCGAWAYEFIRISRPPAPVRVCSTSTSRVEDA